MENSYFLSPGDFYFSDQQPQYWRWWDCCSGSDRVRLHHSEAEGWISSPAGELFRWWDVDLQLWDLAKANIHLDLSGSIQLCSTLTSCSLPLLAVFFFSWGMSLLNCYFSLSHPLILHLTSLACLRNCIVETANLSLVFFTVNWASTSIWWMINMYIGMWESYKACTLFYPGVISITAFIVLEIKSHAS